MWHQVLLILLCLIVPCGAITACRQEKTSQPPVESEPPPANELKSLSQQYLELRKIKGHWGGGDYVADVDSFNGRKQKVMERLGERLGIKGNPRSQVIQWMGEPDVKKTEGTTEQWIYYWRGDHDYLIFVLDNGLVTKSEWYYAYE